MATFNQRNLAEIMPPCSLVNFLLDGNSGKSLIVLFKLSIEFKGTKNSSSVINSLSNGIRGL